MAGLDRVRLSGLVLQLGEVDEMVQRPTAVGLFLCEQLIVEKGTDNLTVVNAFIRQTVASFPSEPFPFLVFALLTDGLGDATIDVVISRLDTMEDLYQRSGSY